MAESDVSTVRASYDAFGRGDFAAVLEAMDPEIEWRDPDSLPYGGSHRGHDAFGAHMSEFASTFEQVQVIPERFLDAGDGVIVVIGRQTGRAKQASFDVPVVWVWELRDGKAVRVESHTDTAAILRALGS